jgi:hypothetical protein
MIDEINVEHFQNLKIEIHWTSKLPRSPDDTSKDVACYCPVNGVFRCIIVFV